jgi:VCBS repeat-containing protein
MFGGNGSTVIDLNAAQGSFSADANGGFTVPAEVLFHGDFKRAGNDLKIVGEHGKAFVVHDYFKTDQHHTLFAPDGAALSGDVVAALAGPLAPGEYAQATPPQSDAQPIGRVATEQGTAIAVRNGVAVTLNVGDAVLKGDVIQTQGNSAVGIILGDGSTFSMGANARMVLSDYVYNPAPGSANASLVNLVQGSITFIAGQIAHTGDMKVGTPVATMGIRGTAVQVDIDVNLGTTKLSVLIEPGDRVGQFDIFSLNGQLLAHVDNATNQWTVTPSGPLEAIATEVLKSPAQMQQALVAVQNAFQTQAIGQTILQQQPVPPSQNNQQPDPNQPNQNPTQNTPKTQIASTDLSTTTIKIDATETSNGTTTHVDVVKPLDNSPATIPLVLTPPVALPPPPPAPPAPPINLQSFFEIGSANLVVTLADNHAQFLSTAGIFFFTDLAGDTHILTPVAHPGVFGQLSLALTSDTSGTSTEGQIAYTYLVSHNSVALLAQGQTHSDVYDVKITDAAGNVTSTEFTVVLLGANDTPVLTLPGATASTQNGATIALTGAHVTDPDNGDVITLNVSVAHGTLSPVDITLPAGVTVDDGDGSDGTLQVHGSAAAISQLLADGVNYTPTAGFANDTMTVTVHDSLGASDSKQVAITNNTSAAGGSVFTLLAADFTTAIDGTLSNVVAGDAVSISTPQSSGYLGVFGHGTGTNTWSFSASTTQLTSLADHTQSYIITDFSHPAGNQTVSVSVGASDQFQFVFNPGSGAHEMMNFFLATDQTGNYAGETVDLTAFHNGLGGSLTLSDVLADLTTDTHGNAVVNLGGSDSVTFHGVSAAIVQAQADHIFALHQQTVV